MTLYVKVVLFFIAGTLGWAVMSGPLRPRWPGAWVHFGWYVDLAVPGLLLGLVEAASLDGTRRRWAAVVLGAISLLASETVSSRLARWIVPQTYWNDPRGVLLERLHVSIEFALLGFFMGLLLSLPRRSLLSTMQYALGGVLGGLCGIGSLLLAVRLLETVAVLDMLKWGIAFGVTAFGIGIAPALFKSTWLTANNMGKRETPLLRRTVTLGSDPNADIHIPASGEAAPVHAVIELLPGLNRRRLRHAAGGTGTHAFPATRVNGRGVTGEQWLSDGDVVQIGSRAWTFHDRATRGAMRLGPVAEGAWGKAKEETQKNPATPAESRAINYPSGGRQEPPAVLRTEDQILRPEGGWPKAPQTGNSLPGTGPGGAKGRDIGRVGTRLLCTDGPYAGRVYPLGPDKTTIGRAEACAVSLPSDTLLLPVHAALTAEPEGGHTLSGNGVQVNEQTVTAPVPLRLGDRIQLGGTTLRYQ